MSDPFEELVARVKKLTGLNARAAHIIANDFPDDETPSAAAIMDKAEELGYEIVRPRAKKDIAIAPEISMDPATVLAEVYEVCPRVLMASFPEIGRAPSELEANPEVMAELEQLPENIRALLVKVDLADQKMTVWLRDEANDVDRPVGPIDLRPYRSGQELHDAIGVLLRRLPLVLRADSN